MCSSGCVTLRFFESQSRGPYEPLILGWLRGTPPYKRALCYHALYAFFFRLPVLSTLKVIVRHRPDLGRGTDHRPPSPYVLFDSVTQNLCATRPRGRASTPARPSAASSFGAYCCAPGGCDRLLHLNLLLERRLFSSLARSPCDFCAFFDIWWTTRASRLRFFSKWSMRYPYRFRYSSMCSFCGMVARATRGGTGLGRDTRGDHTRLSDHPPAANGSCKVHNPTASRPLPGLTRNEYRSLHFAYIRVPCRSPPPGPRARVRDAWARNVGVFAVGETWCEGFQFQCDKARVSNGERAAGNRRAGMGGCAVGTGVRGKEPPEKHVRRGPRREEAQGRGRRCRRRRARRAGRARRARRARRAGRARRTPAPADAPEAAVEHATERNSLRRRWPCRSRSSSTSRTPISARTSFSDSRPRKLMKAGCRFLSDVQAAER